MASQVFFEFLVKILELGKIDVSIEKSVKEGAENNSIILNKTETTTSVYKSLNEINYPKKYEEVHFNAKNFNSNLKKNHDFLIENRNSIFL